MSNDKITESIREPYDAMGPVDAPNPPAARATLADVQPGGRVRLGDQAERARFEAFLSGNPLMALCAGTAWQVWQAALSAQPSPGGQGDALRALVAEWRERAKELSVHDAIGLTHQLKLRDCADELEAAISSEKERP